MSVKRRLIRSITSFFIAVALLYNIGMPLPISALSLSAQSAVLIDGKNGSVLFEKNAHILRPMASTTKIMTAVVAIESGDLDRTVIIPQEAVGVEGSSIYLCKDEALTLRQLLYALLLSSANDAATAIAIEIGGNIEGFAELMNQKAAALGLKNTHFDNPHGLDGKTHYTTACDLALLAAYAMSIDEFREIVSKQKFSIPMLNNENGRLLVNHNKLLRSYQGVIGVKTGFTKKSGRCLVSAAERDGALLIAVTLAAPDDWRDHTAMLDYGFENYESVTLSDGNIALNIPDRCGKQPSVNCEATDSISLLLPKDHGSIICRIEADRFLYAPVSAGESVGKITYICDGRKLAESELFASEDIELKKQSYTIWDRIKELIGI